MRNGIFSLCLPLFLASVFVALGAEAAVPDKIQVGVLLPLTGEFAPWGEGIRRAIEIFATQPQARFAFEFQDEGNCEPQKSVAGYQKLVAGGARYFITGCLAGTKAILPIAKRQRVLLLSVGLVDDESFQQTKQLVNLATQLSTESRYLGARMAARGVKRPAIIHWEDPFSNEFASTLARELTSRGARPVAEEAVNPKETDYRSILMRVSKSNPDAISFNVGQEQQAVILRQIASLNLNVAVFSNYVFETPAAIDAGSIAERVEYTFPLNSADGSEAKNAFDGEFERRFGPGAHPTPNAYFARDGLVLLGRALERCTPEDTECAAASFRSTKSFSGLSGEVSFHDDGSNDRPYGIKKIEHGRFIWAERDPLGGGGVKK